MPSLDTFTLIALTLARGAWTAAQVAAGAALIAAGLGLLLALLVVFVRHRALQWQDGASPRHR